jgi:XTP/dITP diphosphohydrolase
VTRPRLLIATTNPNKLREIRGILASSGADIVGLAELPPVEEPEETGATFEANAVLKASYYDRALNALAGPGALTVAEDSGLVVDALDGEPGVRSARFLRPDAAYPERFAEIFRRLAERPSAPRTARFVCALVVMAGGEILFSTRGVVEGEIAPEARGSRGFGYDPIFFYPPYGPTLAEVSDERKRQVAHRGHAFRALAAWLERTAR